MLHTTLRSRRMDLGLSQRQLAGRVGVARTVVCRWESGRIVPGHSSLAKLAEALDMSQADLAALVAGRERRRPRRRQVDGRSARRPLYPVGASLEQMVGLGGFAARACADVRDRMPADDFRVLVGAYPRDTRWELMVAFQVMRMRSRLVECSLDHLRCPLFALDDYERAAAGFQRQHAILWEGEDERMVLFGQVRVRAASSKAYRVDFLVWYRKRGQRGVWLVLEIDGGQHASTPNLDRARAEDIGVPVIRHDNVQTLSPWYFQQLLEDVREKAVIAADWMRERKRKGRVLRLRRLRQAEERLLAA